MLLRPYFVCYLKLLCMYFWIVYVSKNWNLFQIYSYIVGGICPREMFQKLLDVKLNDELVEVLGLLNVVVIPEQLFLPQQSWDNWGCLYLIWFIILEIFALFPLPPHEIKTWHWLHISFCFFVIPPHPKITKYHTFLWTWLSIKCSCKKVDVLKW